jgi:hypothetical protein
MVRIRYVMETEGRLVSKPIESPVGVFRTVIERDSEGRFNYLASRLQGGSETGIWVIVAEGKSRNLTVAKNKAKLLLKTQGVSFLDEVRRRSERRSDDGGSGNE